MKELLSDIGRPFLTVMVNGVFTGVCVWAVLNSKMTVSEFIAAVGPSNSMILGFWFGERAALKNPNGGQ
jgi:hypothetical protein